MGQVIPLPGGRGTEGEGVAPESPRIPAQLRGSARRLRRDQTDAESRLWRVLRSRQLATCKFRRQHPAPPYVLDFYCHDARLAVELDGGQHFDPIAAVRDRRRTATLLGQGIAVIRFSDREVRLETKPVLEAILQECAARTEQC